MAGLEEKLGRTLFWNVDTQHDFMRKNGKLYVPGAEEIESALEKITVIAREYGIHVVSTADSHQKGSKELSDKPDFKQTFPDHCMYGTEGAEFVPATKPRGGIYDVDWRTGTVNETLLLAQRNTVLTKDDFDIFSKEHGSPHVDRVLELLKPERTFVYGVATNVCVDFAVRGLVERGVEVYVVKDAIKGLPGIPEPTDKWVEMGVKLVESATLEQYLR